MKKAVFIGSVSHSGSTLLNFVLGNNKNCFALGECYAVFRPHKRHHSVAAEGDFSRACSCREKSCSVWTECLEKGESGFYSHLWEKYDVLIDSSKHISWYEDQQKYTEGIGKVKTIVIYKHPADVLLSFYKRQNFTENWSVAYYRYYSEFLNKWSDSVVVSYYDLVSNPKEIAEKACELLEIPYVEKQEEYWNGSYHLLFGKDHVLNHKKFYIDNSWKETKFEIYSGALKLFGELEKRKVKVV